MRKHLSFVCGFVLGALFIVGVLSSGFVPRLFAQSMSGRSELIPLPGPFPPPGVSLINAEAAKPRVPDFWYHLRGQNVGDVVQLDGLDCDGCVLRSRILTYAGGQFRCRNCAITVQGLFLEGAALNTVRALQLAGLIPNAPKGIRPIPSSAQSESASIRTSADSVSSEKEH